MKRIIFSVRVLRCIATTAITILLFVILINTTSIHKGFIVFLYGLFAWKVILDLHLYLCIMKYGRYGEGTLISSITPTTYYGGLNITFRCDITVLFYTEQNKHELAVWGVFHAPPSEIGALVGIIYWDEYSEHVILADLKYKIDCIRHTIWMCSYFIIITYIIYFF